MFLELCTTYALLSLSLFAFPLRKKKPTLRHPLFLNALRSKGVMHISHRGGSRESVENTLEAFRKAIANGTQYLEMDVCFTKDRKVIVNHDSLLLRMTGVNKHSYDLNYSELPRF